MNIQDYSMDRELVRKELDANSHDGSRLYQILRQLPLDLVGDLLLNLGPDYEGPLRRHLPRMASDEIQRNWTGTSGYHLLQQSCAFVRSIENNYRNFSGRSLQDATILDYGCGWGRLMRLMYKYTDPSNLYGCDPWDRSIEICRESGVAGHLAVSDYLPSTLPFGDLKFDLIYAFSVFTHLSERAAATAMSACRKAISSDGIMALTIRPPAYWHAHQDSQNVVDRHQMLRDHDTRGFAFTPHPRPAVDGDVTYGDTSMSLDYIERNWLGWSVLGVDWQLHDPYQTVVFLRPD
ncbi:class I SAM-dependent methyltransferase [Variovorax sp. J2P1-59]|uniref:class I SAM-dependent methyltransferase n=1 Tax=Variovorax flavidus TaxID=3053501 RepID=UPI0025751E1F|nr:class I SAM-dependent methyltransferase [Variovorax sp. J2P1-59]MDM0077390.1 class I SAM-dependent methyltransferase [Variovorax sp. J2P1-59]